MNTNVFRALSEKSFLYLWIGEVFTQIAVNLFNFFLILIIYNLTGSNTAVSGVVLSFTLPAILFGSIAGAYVDRWNKKNVIIVTGILRAVLILLLIPFIHSHIGIDIISFLVASVTQFFVPAESPIIPHIVKKNNLLAANALFGVGIYGSILVAYVLSGPLLRAVGPINLLIILALMFCIAVGFVSLIQLSYEKASKKHETEQLHILKDLKNAFVLISKTTTISRSLFMLALSQILILIIATIAPGYAKSVLHINIEDFPLVFIAPAAIGMIVGAAFIINVLHNKSKEKVITVGVYLSALALVLMPFGSNVTSRGFLEMLNQYLPSFFHVTILQIMVLVAFILGVANSFIFVPANTLLQEKTSSAMRGKIYGLLNTVGGGLAIVPIMVVGWLSDVIGVSVVLVGIGIFLFVLAGIRTIVKT